MLSIQRVHSFGFTKHYSKQLQKRGPVVHARFGEKNPQKEIYPFKTENLKKLVVSPKKRAALMEAITRLKKSNVRRVPEVDDPINQLYRAMHPREFGVIIYGSNKVRPTGRSDGEYEQFQKLAKMLASTHVGGQPLHVVDGGKDGAMEAVGKGAMSVGGHAIGCATDINAKEVGEQGFSGNVHPEYYISNNFTDRASSKGGYFDRGSMFVVGPGGIGTLDEILKSVVKIVLGHKDPVQKQIVLFDYKGFFSHPRGFINHLDYLVETGKMNQAVRDLFKVCKTPEEVRDTLIDPKVPWHPGQGVS